MRSTARSRIGCSAHPASRSWAAATGSAGVATAAEALAGGPDQPRAGHGARRRRPGSGARDRGRRRRGAEPAPRARPARSAAPCRRSMRRCARPRRPERADRPRRCRRRSCSIGATRLLGDLAAEIEISVHRQDDGDGRRLHPLRPGPARPAPRQLVYEPAAVVGRGHQLRRDPRVSRRRDRSRHRRAAGRRQRAPCWSAAACAPS